MENLQENHPEQLVCDVFGGKVYLKDITDAELDEETDHFIGTRVAQNFSYKIYDLDNLTSTYQEIAREAYELRSDVVLFKRKIGKNMGVLNCDFYKLP